MSYADVAASGPSQSAEERASGRYRYRYRRAPAVPEIVQTEDSSTSSLIDVDSPHVSSVPSDFEQQKVKTETQAARIEREADDAKLKAEKEAQKAKEKAKSKFGKGKQTAKENPIMIGEMVAIGVFGTALGVSAYKKYTAGEFNWKLGGIFAGAIGVFAGVDYFVTSWLYQKYPKKN